MKARTYSAVLDDGARTAVIAAEVGDGLPGLVLRSASLDHVEQIGMRVRCALARCGHALAPRQRLVVLGSANASPGIDLAIACAVLAGHEVIPGESLANTMLWSTLGLDGALLATPETPRVVDLARAAGFRRLVVSKANLHDVPHGSGLDVLPIDHLANLVTCLRDELALGFGESSRLTTGHRAGSPDLADMPELARVRGLVELMLAGQHGALLLAPPHETAMLVRRLAGLLPEPDETLASERLALARLGADPRAFVHVLNPRTRPEHVLDQHPAQPGPACLTHGGVLVLDRLYRYPAQLLDAVNDAARGSRVGSWPAEFVLLATGRPSKTPKPHRLSRPRGIGGCIDVLAEFEPPDPRTRAGESSERVRARITLARARQDQRFRGRWLDLGWTRNARIPLHSICLDEFCPTSDSGRALIDQLANHRRWTNDQRGALLRVARTVADLDPDRDPGAPLDRECLATAAMFYQP